tara:strand:- start:1414 stop:2589 length:1176 start_codon:yes stop_codon:yes gene_type:complete
MPDLFDPLKIRSVTFPNRIAVSPMVQTSSKDGFAEDWHLVHLGSRAVGGAGLVITEATAIQKKGRISPNDLGIWKDAHIPKLKKIASFIKQQNSVAGIQLAHAGRKGSYSSPLDKNGLAHLKPLPISKGGWETIAPSSIPFEINASPPKEMNIQDIKDIIFSYASAAIRANKANFDLIEIHAAHGYLLHQFYSPISNKRKDRYGKNTKGRIRLCLEIAEAVRSVWPKEKILSFRISYTDWIKNGWDLNDSINLCKELKKRGVDIIDVSSGGTSPNTVAIAKELIEDRDNIDTKSLIPLEPGYQVKAASSIRLNSKIKTAAVGLITDPELAQKIVSTKMADFTYIGRKFLQDAYWPLRAAIALNQTEKLSIPGQYYLAWRNQENFKFKGYPF